MSLITQELIDALNAGAQRNADEGVAGFREGEDSGQMVRVDQYLRALRDASHPDVIRAQSTANLGPVFTYRVI